MTNALAKGIMKKIGSEGRKMSNKTAQDTKRIYSTVKKDDQGTGGHFCRGRTGRNFGEYV